MTEQLSFLEGMNKIYKKNKKYSGPTYGANSFSKKLRSCEKKGYKGGICKFIDNDNCLKYAKQIKYIASGCKG